MRKPRVHNWLLWMICQALLATPAIAQAQAIRTFTYSYSNLFDGEIDRQSNLTEYEMLRAVEEALALWASVAPLRFVEVADAGPLPTSDDQNYSAEGTPEIRFGHHALEGNVLAHAYFPGSGGLASDVHVDSEGRFWSESLFFTTRHRSEGVCKRIFAEPLPVVVEALRRHTSMSVLSQHLPDADLELQPVRGESD